MAKLVLSLGGAFQAEFPLNKERMTIGRKPDNDVQVDNLAISGKHALIITILDDSFVEDLGSTNGTYINGKAVKKQLLTHNDTVEIGKYKIKYLVEEGNDYEKTM
ncbi:MAG: FHA domain-containing protein, partial [Gammaproteobacteria bacterium]